MSETRFDNGARLIAFDQSQGAARSNNFLGQWIAPGERASVKSEQEMIALFLAGGGKIGNLKAPPYSVAILPAGTYEVVAAKEGAAVVLATDRPDLAVAPPEKDARVAPVGEPYKRTRPLNGPEVRTIESIPFPEGNARLKFLQTATMSINLVIYDGPRSKTALSPHAHGDIEQGSLALEGDFVHHLRTPWGGNAALWKEDVHAKAGAGSLILIPPELVHTSEGVEAGRHFLLDIFAPPRRDFLAKGWVVNAGDYEAG